MGAQHAIETFAKGKGYKQKTRHLVKVIIILLFKYFFSSIGLML